MRGALGWRAWGARQGRAEGVARGRGARQAGRAAVALRARGTSKQRAAGARAGTAWARGWAHGAGEARPAWAWPGRWMGAQAGPVLVHCAPSSVLARFLDPV